MARKPNENLDEEVEKQIYQHGRDSAQRGDATSPYARASKAYRIWWSGYCSEINRLRSSEPTPQDPTNNKQKG